MTGQEIRRYRELFSRELGEHILPFWLTHGLDRTHGGYYTGLDREGKLIESDKSVWFQGRFSWILSTAFMREHSRVDYLEAAESGVNFIKRHCFDHRGRMYYRTTAEGKPLLQRRYYFSELFAVNAFAAFSRASGDLSYLEAARELMDRVETLAEGPVDENPKWVPGSRDTSSIAYPMIKISVLQELRRADPGRAAYYTAKVRSAITSILPGHLIPGQRCLVENLVGGEPSFDHNEGRQLNPGHALELAWFILSEYRETGVDEYLQWGRQIFDWMWEWGWDEQYGGIFYFRDALGYPSSEYWHDMKFWWPHNEAIIASLMLYSITNEPSYLEKFSLAFEWAFERFPDRDYGEWYGYLHRDGSVSSTVKGNLFKGPFHIPRMCIICGDILEGMDT